MSTSEPKPLLDSNTTPSNLREMLMAARSDMPSAAQHASILSRLDAVEPAAVTTSVGIGKLLSLLLVVAAIAGGALWVTMSRGSKLTKLDTQPLVAAEPIVVTQAAKTTVPVQAAARPAPVLKAIVAPTPAKDSPPPLEVELIGRARRALAHKQWTATLRAVRLHRRHHPDGILGEERESIAIEALLGDGKVGQAKSRLNELEASFPRSSYRRRLLQLVEEHDGQL